MPRHGPADDLADVETVGSWRRFKIANGVARYVGVLWRRTITRYGACERPRATDRLGRSACSARASPGFSLLPFDSASPFPRNHPRHHPLLARGDEWVNPNPPPKAPILCNILVARLYFTFNDSNLSARHCFSLEELLPLRVDFSLLDNHTTTSH